ncbi:hypothetical protein X744_29825 [Mesorhizobium sp. LNJC372A00]|nr:hypothetical protein X745_30990 [Mesorhizobium sp. LNJC374B00]ESY52310.1 hypothetical protein X744_29825 [Mesorhizobium sp. LNJC372A00]
MAAEGERKPYEKREGPRKPYAPRGDRPVAADGERPKRDFKGGDRPFRGDLHRHPVEGDAVIRAGKTSMTGIWRG